MAQLTAASSPVVQRHAPWIWVARACSLWCEGHTLQTLSVKRVRACLCTNSTGMLCCAVMHLRVVGCGCVLGLGVGGWGCDRLNFGVVMRGVQCWDMIL